MDLQGILDQQWKDYTLFNPISLSPLIIVLNFGTSCLVFNSVIKFLIWICRRVVLQDFHKISDSKPKLCIHACIAITPSTVYWGRMWLKYLLLPQKGIGCVKEWRKEIEIHCRIGIWPCSVKHVLFYQDRTQHDSTMYFFISGKFKWPL